VPGLRYRTPIHACSHAPKHAGAPPSPSIARGARRAPAPAPPTRSTLGALAAPLAALQIPASGASGGLSAAPSAPGSGAAGGSCERVRSARLVAGCSARRRSPSADCLRSAALPRGSVRRRLRAWRDSRSTLPRLPERCEQGIQAQLARHRSQSLRCTLHAHVRSQFDDATPAPAPQRCSSRWQPAPLSGCRCEQPPSARALLPVRWVCMSSASGPPAHAHAATALASDMAACLPTCPLRTGSSPQSTSACRCSLRAWSRTGLEQEGASSPRFLAAHVDQSRRPTRSEASPASPRCTVPPGPRGVQLAALLGIQESLAALSVSGDWLAR
jgi:hypothetical protein